MMADKGESMTTVRRVDDAPGSGTAEASMNWGLAIDFGTTTTAAAVCDSNGNISRLAYPHGAFSMPSSVFADDEQLLAGYEADNFARLRLDSYEPTPKRRVGPTRGAVG